MILTLSMCIGNVLLRAKFRSKWMRMSSNLHKKDKYIGNDNTISKCLPSCIGNVLLRAKFRSKWMRMPSNLHKKDKYIGNDNAQSQNAYLHRHRHHLLNPRLPQRRAVPPASPTLPRLFVRPFY
jgi:hypothetical protein